MLEMQLIGNALGVPVYFQKSPETEQSVSIRLIMFNGSADDEQYGDHGTFHWFEHVPFRGTAKFPNGYDDTGSRFDRYHGEVGAHTGRLYTAYYATVPIEVWQEALDLLVDMVANPLMTLESIEAERLIIKQELAQLNSNPTGKLRYDLDQLLWDGHPIGHPIIGTPESLDRVSADSLRNIHTQAYSRSRCVLIVSGNLDAQQLLTESQKQLERVPETGASERRNPASFGPLPSWKTGETTVIESDFDTSVVFIAFPFDSTQSQLGNYIIWNTIDGIFDTKMQFVKELREKHNLVYSASNTMIEYPDGGIWVAYALMQSKNIDAAINAMWETVNQSRIRTLEHYEYCLDRLKNEPKMRTNSPESLVDIAQHHLVDSGKMLSDQERIDAISSISHDELVAALDTLTPEKAGTFILKGK